MYIEYYSADLSEEEEVECRVQSSVINLIDDHHKIRCLILY